MKAVFSPQAITVLKHSNIIWAMAVLGFCAVQAFADPFDSISIGMKRSDVEAILTHRDGGPQGISSTRYYEAGRIIEVSYDQTGGTWTGENRVLAPVTVLAVTHMTFLPSTVNDRPYVERPVAPMTLADAQR